MGVGGEVGLPESMFRSLFEAGPDAVVILDGSGSLVNAPGLWFGHQSVAPG